MNICFKRFSFFFDGVRNTLQRAHDLDEIDECNNYQNGNYDKPYGRNCKEKIHSEEFAHGYVGPKRTLLVYHAKKSSSHLTDVLFCIRMFPSCHWGCEHIVPNGESDLSKEHVHLVAHLGEEEDEIPFDDKVRGYWKNMGIPEYVLVFGSLASILIIVLAAILFGRHELLNSVSSLLTW